MYTFHVPSLPSLDFNYPRLLLLLFHFVAHFLSLHSSSFIAYEYAPSTFENTWTKNNARNTGYDLRNQDFFTLPVVPIEAYSKFPIYSLANEWNNLGDNIRLQQNCTTFKIPLRDELISISWGEVMSPT